MVGHGQAGSGSTPGAVRPCDRAGVSSTIQGFNLVETLEGMDRSPIVRLLGLNLTYWCRSGPPGADHHGCGASLRALACALAEAGARACDGLCSLLGRVIPW